MIIYYQHGKNAVNIEYVSDLPANDLSLHFRFRVLGGLGVGCLPGVQNSTPPGEKRGES